MWHPELLTHGLIYSNCRFSFCSISLSQHFRPPFKLQTGALHRGFSLAWLSLSGGADELTSQAAAECCLKDFNIP